MLKAWHAECCFRNECSFAIYDIDKTFDSECFLGQIWQFVYEVTALAFLFSSRKEEQKMSLVGLFREIARTPHR